MFYDRLLSGATFGEAIAAARWQTWNDHQSVNTWGAYQCYGDPDYRLAPTRSCTGRTFAAGTGHARAGPGRHREPQPVGRHQPQHQGGPRPPAASSTRRSAARTARTTRSRCSSPAPTRSSATPAARRSTSSTRWSTAGLTLTVRDFEVWIDQMVRVAATTTATELDDHDAVDARSPRSSGHRPPAQLLDDPGSLVPRSSRAAAERRDLSRRRRVVATRGDDRRQRRPAVAGRERLQAARARHLPGSTRQRRRGRTTGPGPRTH